MKLMKLFFYVATLSLVIAFTSCHRKKEDNVLKVGIVGGPGEDVIEEVAKVAREKYGLNVQIVTFSDYMTPNAALNDGSIDLNAFQHKPFLDAQIKDRGYRLVSVGNTFVYPIAAYSQKIKTLDQLPDGAKVAVPNDPTNLGRSLLLLEKQGLIKLKENAGLTATPLDIVDNPKKLKIIELEAPQLPRALQDVDLAIINNDYSVQVGLLATRDGLFVEEKNSPYVNIIAAREENQHDKNIQDFVKAYQTPEVFERAKKLFKGGVIQGW